MKQTLLLVLVGLFGHFGPVGSAATAQTVSSLPLSQFLTADGLFAAPDGTIYAAGGWNKTDIFEISPEGIVSSFATGLDGPIHMAMDADGNLYVSTWNDRKIFRLDEEGGIELFAEVDPYPTGLAFGPDGNLYVGHAPPSGTGGISRVTPGGVATNFVIGRGVDRPVGIAFDDDGNLYSANLYDTRINKITPSGEVTFLANAPAQVNTFTIGHMVYAGGALYATDIGHHQIMRISLTGAISVFSGTGDQGDVDGDVSAAQFAQPNGITASPDGTKLYIHSIGAKNFLRVITLSQATGSELGDELASSVTLAQNYPNPFNPSTNIQFDIDTSQQVRLSVFDMMGREVAILVNGVMPAGEHSARFEAGNLPGGAYLYRLSLGTHVESRIMTLVK